MIHQNVIRCLTTILLTAGVDAATLTVTNTNDTGAGSLRQAIVDSNTSVGVLDTITFNIPGAGVHTITPVATLVITDPVVIDGYTQPGAKANTLANGDDAVILIELNGASATGNHNGLQITAGNSVVRGLVINRFTGNGVFLATKGGNVVDGCFIGTDAAGAAALPNAVGVFMNPVSNNVIGGTTPAARNVISGNVHGVELAGPSNIVQGNFIGTDRTGTKPLGNAQEGIRIDDSTNLIGGTDAGARNVISDNKAGGIIVNTSTGSKIQGNLIGTDVTGTAKLGNGNNGNAKGHGIYVYGAIGTLIGGAGAGNLICASAAHGIWLDGSVDPVIQGNFIGTDFTGKLNLGNGYFGVDSFTLGAGKSVKIGGTAPGEGNTIAFNGAGLQKGDGGGVHVDSFTTAPFTVNTTILGNAIYSNVGLGIDLGDDTGGYGDGVTPNDAGDVDDGSNHLQNFPVLTSVSSSGGLTSIAGTLNSTANTIFRIELFANDTIDPSGFGEGQSFVGFINVTTDASGSASFTASVPQIAAGRRITSTATDPAGNTSEFSGSVGQLLNISTRLRVQTGENVLIAGFIITGTDPKKVIVRGIGPSLSGFVQGFLADPTLELHDASGTLATNDNWKTKPDGSSQQAEIEATTIPPTNDLESAIVRILPANNAAYTAIVRGKNNTTGIGVVEAYDLDQGANSKLANISTRGFVETDNNVLIGGFIAGLGPTKVIVRAIGPSLTNVGVTNPLQDPTLELHDNSGAIIATNDNWKTRPDGSSQQTEIEATTIPPANDLESALIATLLPGNYTAIVRGKNNTTGVGLVEAYNIK
jgi:hypothetical protein